MCDPSTRWPWQDDSGRPVGTRGAKPRIMKGVVPVVVEAALRSSLALLPFVLVTACGRNAPLDADELAGADDRGDDAGSFDVLPQPPPCVAGSAPEAEFEIRSAVEGPAVLELGCWVESVATLSLHDIITLTCGDRSVLDPADATQSVVLEVGNSMLSLGDALADQEGRLDVTWARSEADTAHDWFLAVDASGSLQAALVRGDALEPPLDDGMKIASAYAPLHVELVPQPCRPETGGCHDARVAASLRMQTVGASTILPAFNATSVGGYDIHLGHAWEELTDGDEACGGAHAENVALLIAKR